MFNFRIQGNTAYLDIDEYQYMVSFFVSATYVRVVASNDLYDENDNLILSNTEECKLS